MLARIRIARRLSLAIAIPLIVLCAIAGFGILQKWQSRTDMARLARLVENVETISAFVHELQRERGLSALFVASKGANAAAELPQQRERTNAQRQKIQPVWTELRQTRLNKEFMSIVDQAEAAARELDAMRANISSLTATAQESGGYYTDAIAKLIAIAGELSSLSTRGDIAMAMDA